MSAALSASNRREPTITLMSETSLGRQLRELPPPLPARLVHGEDVFRRNGAPADQHVRSHVREAKHRSHETLLDIREPEVLSPDRWKRDFDDCWRAKLVEALPEAVLFVGEVED